MFRLRNNIVLGKWLDSISSNYLFTVLRFYGPAVLRAIYYSNGVSTLFLMKEKKCL